MFKYSKEFKILIIAQNKNDVVNFGSFQKFESDQVNIFNKLIVKIYY